MKTSEFLKHLRSLNVKVWTSDGELRCSAPKGVLTPELRAELGQRKADILAVLDARDSSGASKARRAETPPVVRVSRDRALPLSFPQRRLWFLQKLDPEMSAYNLGLSWIIKGDLDVRALERTLTEIVRRHETLRTTFPQENGVPVQSIAEPYEIRFDIIDDSEGLTQEEWLDEIKRRMMELGETAFDVERGPLIRTRLYRQNERKHFLFIPIHHVIFDGISIALFTREMITLYEAFVAGRPSPLPELEVQYADFAVWQDEYFKGDQFAETLDYWKHVLRGTLPVLELPTDRPRPPVQTYNGEQEERPVPNELVDALRGLAKKEGATLYMVLLAAYKTLLHRYTGQTDIIVGSAINGRVRPEVNELLGFFVNTLVLRTDLSGDPTFRELLERERDVCLGAFEHHDIPFERLLEEVQPERNLSYAPVFQTLFLHELDPEAPETMADLEIVGLGKEEDMEGNRVSRNDLTMWISYDKDEFIAWAEYNTDLFEGDRIQRMLGYYLRILEEVVADPDRRLSELPMLPESERRQLLDEWNDTAREYPELPIHAQFEALAERTPDAAAVIFPGAASDGSNEEVLSYAELDGRANRLAQHLIAQGVQPGSMVGLCVERSPRMVEGLLAIQKCGAAYVPLDPGFPVDRLAYMVEDAALDVVVSETRLSGLLPSTVRLVSLDASADEIAQRPSTKPDVASSVDDRMYVIYTSGSTGRPKGVEIAHRSVSNFLASMAREPGFASGERLLAVTTLSFDISNLELLLPLVVGGTVIVASSAQTGDGAALKGLLSRYRPEVMQATPATWRLLLLSGWEGDSQLRIFSGGEALPRELADSLLERGKEVWNLYGPTETTIWSAVKRIEPDEEIVTIGRPIACTRIYVLDAHFQPQPVGVPGELWIGGDGLAIGYLKRPELTAERFVEDPFVPGARMYRTGDMARWRSDGELECLGRVDTQVKVRGYRIELGEIESVLGDVEGVQQCVAVVREDTPGDQRLVAYFVSDPASREGAEVSQADLRSRAQETLPSYMVPSGFVELETLPLTPNGKVDRKALLALEAAAPSVEAEYVAPRSESEARVAEIWQAVLRLERVSVTTNFFDLGGHSLLLARVHAKLAERHADLSIVDLFQYPTVASLAAHLGDGAVGAGEGAPAVRERRGRDLAKGKQALMQRRKTKR